MENRKFDVLLYDDGTLFSNDPKDNLIRLNECTLSELLTLMHILDRQDCVSIACFPYLDE